MDTDTSPDTLEDIVSAYRDLKKEIAKVIVGQDEIIEQIFVSLICRGHVLLVGVPGLAKTLLVQTISNAIDLSFGRIQFTPDLMPSDITGTELIEEDVATGRRIFKFVKGPVFANVILADEINRTPPKTQAALLEAMQEHRVTASGETYDLPDPFFVLATQNPIEQEGTYPLPEAQLDRFMLNLWLDYPSFDHEVEIVRKTTSAEKPSIGHVMSAANLIDFQLLVRQMPVADNVIEHAVRLVFKTRPASGDTSEYIRNYISYGAGPRASQYLILGAKAMAAIDGRITPGIEDVDRIAISVLRHRLVLNFSAEADGVSDLDIINRLLNETE